MLYQFNKVSILLNYFYANILLINWSLKRYKT